MKTVLVTGGVRGIGLAIARAFLDKGYRVCVSYSKDEQSAKEAESIGLEVYRADCRQEKDVREMIGKIGGVDILVNNAGVAMFRQVQDVAVEEFDDLFAVNVRGAFLCVKHAVPYMIAKKSGLIVNVSSVWGEVGGSCESVYSASKGALIAFTKALASELGYSGIRVNTVSPGLIATTMNARLSEEDIAALVDEIPVGRIGTGEDVAKAVVFLEENEYVTGVDIPVNGGFSIV